MYQVLNVLHSWNKWLVLVFAVMAIFHALGSMKGDKPYTALANKLSMFFILTLHLQLVLGLLLYVAFSPVTQSAFADFGAAMKNATLRYWAVEHLTVGILAVIAGTVGRALSKKKELASAKYKTVAIFYSITLLLIAVNIFLPLKHGKELFLLP